MRQILQVSKVTWAIFCLALSGCISVFSVRHVELSWDAVSADRPLNDGRYEQVRVNLERLRSVLTVRMPDGKLLQTSQIAPQTIWPYTFFGKIGNQFPQSSLQGSAQLSVLFDCSTWSSGGGFNFEFKDGRLVAIAAAGDRPSCPESCRPAIGNAQGKVVYAMPLSEEQLIKLFGPLRKQEEVRGGGLVPL